MASRSSPSSGASLLRGNAVFNIGGANVAVINDGGLPYAEVRRVAESAIETAPAVSGVDRTLDER